MTSRANCWHRARVRKREQFSLLKAPQDSAQGPRAYDHTPRVSSLRVTKPAASGLAVMLACATCSNPEPAMSAPSSATTILSAFTPLQGGDGQAIAPGGRLVTLGGRATWWEGTVRVGCLHGNAIREAAKVATGQKLAIIQHVGDRIALMGGGASPVWVASFSNPCH